MTAITENLLHIRSSIPTHVTLVAVSKTKPADVIIQAYEAGQRDFGENYVQELVDKYHELPHDIHWHFIGHLQRNKVKYIAPFVHLIHGIDSFSLLQEVNKQAQKNNRIISCLLQIHIAQEETKFGLSFSEATRILMSEELKDLKYVALKGFMAMASNTDDEIQLRKEFSLLKKFADEYKQLPTLSIGMSSDYVTAIECGSTMVRIGSLVFGKRIYP